jgi:hypothetical protein
MEEELEVGDGVVGTKEALEALAPGPPSKTLASISTTLASSGSMKMIARIQTGGKVPRGYLCKRSSARLRKNHFHNLVHNYGFENTSRAHIPSN